MPCHGGYFPFSKQVAFHLLALIVPGSVITSISIAHSIYSNMDETLVVIVCSVYSGKVISTRRKVLEVDVVALDPCVFN